MLGYASRLVRGGGPGGGGKGVSLAHARGGPPRGQRGGARRGWHRSYRSLPRAQPGPERSGGTRPHPQWSFAVHLKRLTKRTDGRGGSDPVGQGGGDGAGGGGHGGHSRVLG